MNVTLTLDDDLVKKVRKIAVDRETTLTGMVREYLKQVTEEEEAKRRQLEALRESFRKHQWNFGKKTWTRADLHERR